MGRLGRKANIEKRVHFHGLRHAHARELASENTPINVIQQQLGHSNISTTHTYLCLIAPQQLIQTMQARDWSL
jgi:site-specific recombinase XerD